MHGERSIIFSDSDRQSIVTGAREKCEGKSLASPLLQLSSNAFGVTSKIFFLHLSGLCHARYTLHSLLRGGASNTLLQYDRVSEREVGSPVSAQDVRTSLRDWLFLVVANSKHLF